MQKPPIEEELSLIITFDKANATYKPNDWVTGKIKIEGSEKELVRTQIQGITLQAEGAIQIQNKQSNKDLEAVSGHLPQTVLFSHTLTIANSQYIDQDSCEFPFKFKLTPNETQKLVETYVGVYITVGYDVTVDLKQSAATTVSESSTFFVQVNQAGREMINEYQYPHTAQISINPDKLRQGSMNAMPKIKISGVINSDYCMIASDFTGHFVLEECEGKIRSVDLQLIRVESVSNSMGKFQEATEIQLIQVCDGNVSKGIEIPLVMMFPKYFCCPNFTWKDFTVEFEVNFIIILFDGFKITLNYPIKLIRN